MIKNKTPLPTAKHTETDLDKYFTYLVSHVTRTPDIQPIATISPDQSAQRTWTTPQITILAILAMLTIVALWTFGTAILTVIFAVITCLYVMLLCLSTAWMIAVARAQPSTSFDETIIADLAKAPWPRYTVLCPLYHEKNIVPQFVQAMQVLDYPQDCLQVLFLTEQDDRETRAAIRAMKLPANFEVIIVPQGTPKTKPRACNYGLTKATGEYVVIYDAEDIPDPLQLKKAVLTFASNDVNVACVQARLNFYNVSQNLITRWFCVEYSLWFDLILPGLQQLGFSLPLGGTSNHFRISALKALGGWDSFNVTEDCDLGLRLARYNLKTIMLDSTTYEEANSRVFSWIKQRSRWIKGYMQTYLVHTRSPQKTVRRGNIRELLSLHLFVGAGSVVLLINPVMWCMFVVYLVFRPVDLYHHLFPWPVLYAGMVCFLVGNFLPVYVSMIACVKREQYALVKWCLLLPLYWILASVAAFLAGYELLTNPHKWRKTEHGLHLKHKPSTQKIVAISMKHVAVAPAQSAKGNVTQSVRAMSTVLMPAVMKERLKRSVKWDPWLWTILALATVCSVCSTIYYFNAHEIVIYGDAVSHLRIARGVIDSVTPGIAQFGSVWLPLPHLLMLPFVWNNYLWATGLAGSFVGMICFLVATVYIFLAARRITGKSVAAFVGVLVFIFNPNVLYLQATPMTEPVCWATFSMTCYYLLAWIQEEKKKYLILAAAGTFLATLARYDGWILVVVVPVLIVVVGWIRHYPLRKIEGHLTLFGILGFLGIALWLAWGLVIFGDPLYFQKGPFSSQTQTNTGTLAVSDSLVRHNVLGAIRMYGIDTIETVGLGLIVLAFLAMGLFLLRRWKSVDTLGMFAFLVPFGFYIAALTTGQVALFDNHAQAYLTGAIPLGESTHLFNSRFGSEMVAPIAVFIATLIPSGFSFKKIRAWRQIAHFSFVAIIVAGILLQSLLVSRNGVVSVLSNTNPPFCVGSYPINVYLAEHYEGGFILQTEYPFHLSEAEANINFSNVIWEGSNPYWTHALLHPATSVDWVVLAPGDRVDLAIKKNDPNFSREFTEVASSPWSLQLYHRNGLPPLPDRPIPTLLQSEAHFCSLSTYPHAGK